MLASALVGLASWPALAEACSCERADPATEFARSSAVFLGEVLALTCDAFQCHARLRVETWWKGDLATEVTVSTAAEDSSCGYGLRVGERHLLFAHATANGLGVGLCSASTGVARADSTLDVLDDLADRHDPIGAASGPTAAIRWHLDAEALTDFPLQLGVGARLEAPNRLHARTSLGFMPGPYLDAINGTATAIAGDEYSDSTADLVSAALESSLVWRLGAGWQPWAEHGFYFEGGYTLITLGGGATGAELISGIVGQPVPNGRGDQNYDVASTLHLVGFETGWRWWVTPDLALRAALGGVFTVSSSTSVKASSGSRTAVVRYFEDFAADYLDDIYTSYVHAPTLTFGAAWRFF